MNKKERSLLNNERRMPLGEMRHNKLFMLMNLDFIIMSELNMAGVQEAKLFLVKGKAGPLKN